VAAPDPFPSGKRGPGAQTSSKGHASWRSGFHMWGSRTSPPGFGACPWESEPVEAGPEHFVQVDTWQRQTCHLVGSGPGSHCPPTVRSGLLCPAAQRLSARLQVTSRLFGFVAVGEGTPVRVYRKRPPSPPAGEVRTCRWGQNHVAVVGKRRTSGHASGAMSLPPSWLTTSRTCRGRKTSVGPAHDLELAFSNVPTGSQILLAVIL